MKTEDIAEMRRLLAEATPGVWRITGESARSDDPSGCGWDSRVLGAYWATGPTVATAAQATRDLRIIVAAVNALPGILDALEAARGAAMEEVARRVENATIGVWRWSRAAVAAEIRALAAKEEHRG